MPYQSPIFPNFLYNTAPVYFTLDTDSFDPGIRTGSSAVALATLEVLWIIS